ncbi:hypothetical protein HF086_000762 [Spodoptera exigua]|uniref:ATP-dependent RNA helicase n=1 Tax=Spodoptera exigua TaxID=7107 RepID=A0A922MQP4_SPOEX|nr:hypothetical protein HF086_000762 [Spodoptera exigua]
MTSSEVSYNRKIITEDLSNVEFDTSEDVEVIPTFDSMGLRDELLRGIYTYGFEKPSAIQQRSILPIVKGRDVIAQAQSGTGKTATFSISILQSLDTTLRETQVLVLSPTRELATQIQKVILALGDFMNVQCHACIGGTNLGEDIRKLDYGQHVVSGTPGRVFVNACTVNQIQDKESWYVDNGATTHIAVSRKMFTDFREFDSNHTVTTADGTVIPAVGIGSIKVESKVNETKVHITLEEVWLVPSLTKNLFSPLAAQDRAQNSIFTSTTKKCKLEIEGMTKVVGRRIPKGGLYKLDFKTDATDTTEQDDDGEFVDAEGEENFPAEGEQQPLDIVEPLRVEVPRLEGEEEEIVVEPLR